jgi:hypothetical protein
MGPPINRRPRGYALVQGHRVRYDRGELIPMLDPSACNRAYMRRPQMLAPHDAVQIVVEHLRMNGHQVDQVTYPMGSPPIVRVKGRSGTPDFRISFLVGVSSFCGTRFEPVDWEHTVKSLRDQRAGLQDLKARKHYLALGSERSCKALVMTGSVAGREDELSALAEELGFSLMLIDEQQSVISAMLNFPESTSSADA